MSLPQNLLVSIIVTSLSAPSICAQTSAVDGKRPSSKDPLGDLAHAWSRIDKLEKELEALSKEFRDPGTLPTRREKIRAEGMAIQGRFESTWERVLDLFPAAYDKDPASELVLDRLPRMLRVFLQYHRFAEVERFSQVMIERSFEEHLGRQALGVALFASHRFQRAAHAFLEAREVGGGRLDPQFAHFEKMTAACLKEYPRELELRDKEKKADDLPRVALETSRGKITLELFENEAPGTVGNFVHLVESGFYKGITFHRVIPLFMAQGGDPLSRDDDSGNDGRGGPGYSIPCECGEKDARMHFSGSLSMAHSGKDTGGSQFFITHLPTTNLNGRHTVFGRVTEGLTVVRTLKVGDKILDARILRKRDHEYVPAKVEKAKRLPAKR